MSKGYRNGAFALGLVVGGGLVLNLVLWSAYKADKAGESIPQNPEDAQGHPRVGFWDWFATTFIQTDDTIAQWGMTVLSLAAVYLLWEALKAGRQTLNATRDMARDTQRIGEAQVKAYLSIESVSLSIYDAVEWPVVEVVIKNSGQSPATNLEIKVRFDFWMRADGQKSVTERSPALMLASDVSANSTVVAGPTIFQGEYFDSSFFRSSLVDLVGAKIDVVVYAESVFEKEITTYGSFMAPWCVSGDKHSPIAMKRIDSNHFKDGTVDDLRSEHRNKKG